MSDFLLNSLFSIITGIVASTLVVIYFEYKLKKKYALSRSHLVVRFKQHLFGTITVVRGLIGLSYPKVSGELEVLQKLEEIMGRNDPSIIMNGLLRLTPEDHQSMFSQLTLLHTNLENLLSDAMAHKTLEDKITASIAEMQDWIDIVLQMYTIFPELLHGKYDAKLLMHWSTAVFNMVENSFAIFHDILKLKTLSPDELRWASRTLK
jgi:hypothetical protein